MQSHSLIQVGRDLKRPPQSSINYCSTPGWSQLHPAKAWIPSGREDTPLMVNFFQSLTTWMGKTFFPCLQSASPLVQPVPSFFFLVPFLGSPEKSLALHPFSSPQEAKCPSSPNSAISSQDEAAQPPSLSSSAMISLMALHGLLPIGQPLSCPRIHSLAQGLHKETVKIKWRGRPPSPDLQGAVVPARPWGCKDTPLTLCSFLYKAPRAFWAEVPFSRLQEHPPALTFQWWQTAASWWHSTAPSEASSVPRLVP